MIRGEHIRYSYKEYDDEGRVSGSFPALRNVNVRVTPGEFVAILGPNGSGKSTLARHMNALLLPDEGTMYVGGLDTRPAENLLEVRRTAGMVFQNPDNQIVAGIVEEDVAFGPENLGVPTEEIRERVDRSLEAVSMTEFREKSPNRLSGGQKQRVAIAGVLAMKPGCIVMDEPTAMLDPAGRKEILATIRQLHAEGISIILITHHMEEALAADRVIVVSEGRIVMDGTPAEVFTQVDRVKELRLDVPPAAELAHELRLAGAALPERVLTNEAAAEALASAVKASKGSSAESPAAEAPAAANAAAAAGAAETAEAPQPDHKKTLRAEHLTFKYHPDTPMETVALDDVSVEIGEGEFVGIIGHTGSGKSTLIQHLNGLIRPTSGDLLFCGESIYQKGYSLKDLRGQVGLVFQYPEHQLFMETVLEDVCFGPKNLGLSDEEAEARAREALAAVGMAEETFDRSPFDLSGGQKRRAAIAGVLAMQPSFLILDEPTAGLDPAGRDEILHELRRLHDEKGTTIILVSHSMEDMAEYTKRLLVMDHGKLVFDANTREVFSHRAELEAIGLAVPEVTVIAELLRERGVDVPADLLTVPEAKDAVLRAMGMDPAPDGAVMDGKEAGL
ncbi:MAG: energy-coupling factor transporter ATPase [Lachnospiraceae bacterium]|nr:energy-coupling factor transporter ATPase [Lachnospiraceae bacterium]